MNFTRGLDPKAAMNTGKYANPTKVRCLKNMYSAEYNKLRFVRKQIYRYEKKGFANLVYDNFDRPRMFEDIMFGKFFEIYA